MINIENTKLSCSYKGRIINFEIIYRKRKTMSIEVNLKGEVRVLSPINVCSESILDVVQNKGSWICKKQDELLIKSSIKPSNKYVNGEKYLYLGKEYVLSLKLDKEIKRPCVLIEEGKLNITYKEVDSESIKCILELWYRERTLELVRKRVDIYSEFFKDKPKELKVKEQKRRWASCTYDNRILFNWRISMAPIEVIDYIVVHEMCHMDYKDHSANYWKRVKSVMINYEVYKFWLKENGLKLDI